MKYQIPLIETNHASLTGRSRARYTAKRLADFSVIARTLADRCWPFEVTEAGLAFEPRDIDRQFVKTRAALFSRLEQIGIVEPLFECPSPGKKPKGRRHVYLA